MSRSDRRTPAAGGRGALALFALLTGFAAAVHAEPEESALVIRQGSVAQRQLVAIGRDVEVAGEAAADVAAVNGSVRITGSVAGDVIVLGGDARLGAASVVEGDVFVLGGRIEAAPGARIGGRSVAYPSMSSAWLVLLEGPTLGQAPFSPVVVGAKLALIAAWLGWSLILFATSGRELLSSSEMVAEQPFRNFFVGLTGVLAAFLTAIFFSAFAAAVVGLPLLGLVILLAVLFKLWGMVAVFHAFGHRICAGLLRRRWIPLNEAVVGLLVLGGLKMLPWVGIWVWTVATLIGVGGTLTTKFGRREPWFESAVAI